VFAGGDLTHDGIVTLGIGLFHKYFPPIYGR
jgi:hypothetical protein